MEQAAEKVREKVRAKKAAKRAVKEDEETKSRYPCDMLNIYKYHM